MSTLLTPDIELFVDLATAYPDSLVISGTPFVLSGFRALQDGEAGAERGTRDPDWNLSCL